MLDRSEIKREAKEFLRRAQVPLLLFSALFLLLSTALSGLDILFSGTNYDTLLSSGLMGMFTFVLITLIKSLMNVGVTLYCMGIRRGERMSYSDLFGAFAFAFRAIAVLLITSVLTALGLCLFIFPGLYFFYRYRYAIYFLCEDPETGVLDALRQSAEQTRGFCLQLFVYDISFFGWIFLANLPTALFNGFFYDALWMSDAVYALLLSLLSYPVVLLNFYHCTGDLGCRERIQRLRSAQDDQPSGSDF